MSRCKLVIGLAYALVPLHDQIVGHEVLIMLQMNLLLSLLRHYTVTLSCGSSKHEKKTVKEQYKCINNLHPSRDRGELTGCCKDLIRAPSVAWLHL